MTKEELIAIISGNSAEDAATVILKNIEPPNGINLHCYVKYNAEAQEKIPTAIKPGNPAFMVLKIEKCSDGWLVYSHEQKCVNLGWLELA